MLGKTHMVVGIASTLALTRPENPVQLLAATAIGAFGAMISDIDVDSSDSHQKANIATLAAVIMVVGVFILDFFFHTNLLQQIISDSNIFRIVTGCLIFVVVCAFGKEQPHRSFMHSFLALAVLSFAIGLVNTSVVKYFAVGFISHLFIDSFNYKKLKLFYPSKKGFCLKLCYANGAANSVLFVIGTIISVVMVAFLAYGMIRRI